MPATHFPSGSNSYGMPTVGSGRPVGVGGPGVVTGNAATATPGPGSQVFWVNSALATASDAADHGTDPLTPFKTINFAVTRCIANNNDVIYVGAQHVETIAAASALTFGVAGVTVIFLGNEVDRATINFTATAGSVVISAANVRLVGALFTNSIDALVAGLQITGADCILQDTEWRDGSAKNTVIQIITSASATRLQILGYRYFEDQVGGGTTKTEAIRIVGGSFQVFQEVNITGTFSTGCINNVTTLFVSALFKWCNLNNLSAGPVVAMAVLTTSTFAVIDSTFGIVSGATGITASHKGQIDMASSVCVPGSTPVIVGHA